MKKLTTEDFITKSNIKHNNIYDYSKTIYKTAREYVFIICKDHGVFEQKASYHLQGNGCPLCSGNIKRTFEQFVLEANEIHDNKYLYTHEYINTNTPIAVTCPEHGIFIVTPVSHIHKKIGCSRCSSLYYDTASFILICNSIHSNKYLYGKTTYANPKTPVNITCKIHGDFELLPYNHVRGQGCPSCFTNVSKTEESLLQYISSIYDGDILSQYRPKWLNGKELDIYIPELNLAIEYNGLAYHHSTDHVNTFLDKTKKPIDYHLNKYTICLNNNINLIHIFEFEDLSIWRDLIKNFIINPELYTINFSNTLRVIKDLNVYGLSGISNKL